MKNKSILISKENYSKERAIPPLLSWLSKTAKVPSKEIALFTNNESNRLVDNIISLNLSSSISAAFLTFLTTVLYRYTYQTEFEIQYILKSNDKLSNKTTLQNFLRINFQEHTQQTVDEACLSLSKILTENDSSSTAIKSPFQSAICLIELNHPFDETLENLHETCTLHGCEVWPVIEKKEKGYTLNWLYDQRIPVEKISTLQSHLLQLVSEFQKQPGLYLSKYNILTDYEVKQQIKFSKGESCKNESPPLYKLIEQHAITYPDKIAVSCEKTKLTYSQLNTQANKLAHALLSKKVTNGSNVAVHIMPSVYIIASILAIHKIGAVYVPIDPSFPSSRIQAVLDEINPVVLLCDEQPNNISNNYSSLCYMIDTLIKTSSSEANPDILVGIEDISHIYFTSGTTGKPKGVLSTHENLNHYISSAINRYQFNLEDIFIAAARFTFSISMFELLVPLVAGATVKILPRETVLDLSQLTKAVASATVFHFGPSLLRQLLPYIEKNYSSFKEFEKLIHVSSGGDMVPPEIIEKLITIFTNAKVFVIYGSSEISCMGCTYGVPRNKKINKTLVGSPHQNTQVRLFDKDGNMVPIGVPGQIYFSGKGLVKGYLNLPKLTKEKFILIDSERFYSIGDIGRLDYDGNIALLGREDFQVQIRGMRIELLEIERCLKKYQTITDCIVIARDLHENEEKSLIAYLVIDKNEKIIVSDLNKYVAEQLPDYMIPAVFIKLDMLPVNHNAKLDRSQLPKPNSENIIISTDHQPASSNIEKTLIKIWQELFKIKNIGIDHNFFELGGDSLLAVNFLIEVDNKFNKFIPISIMLEAPTIREIAKILATNTPIEGMSDIVVLKKGNSEPPLFCLDGILIYKDLANSLNTKRMVCGVYLKEDSSAANNSNEFELYSSFENIVSRYLKSIQVFQPNGPYYLCGLSFGGIIALEVAKKLKQKGEAVHLVAMFDSYAPGYLKSLSHIKRIFIHLRLITQLGWPYLKQKIVKRLSMYTIRMAARTKIKSNLVSGINDISAELRDIAFESYLPSLYQDKVVLFKAQQNSDFESGLNDLGWGQFIPKLEVHKISGNHIGILKQSHVEEISNLLLKDEE